MALAPCRSVRGVAIDQQTRLPAEPLGAHPAGRSGSHQLWSQDPAQRCCCGLGLLAVLPWGPAGAGHLNELFISAGHFFSSSCGTALPEGICPCIPAGAWGEAVKKMAEAQCSPTANAISVLLSPQLDFFFF